MKKLLCVMMVLLLTGCGVQETYETVDDEAVQPVMAQPKQIFVQLPEDALAPVLDTQGEQLYFSQDYEVLLETRQAGDLQATVNALCGYELEELTILQSQQEEAQRYDFVWACMGEDGDRMGRAVILDDGDYHYCMTVLRDAKKLGVSQISWKDVFSSFRIGPGIGGTGL